MEHLSPAWLGETQPEEKSGRPWAEVLGPVPHALAHGIQGETAVHTAVEYKVLHC